MYRGVGEIMSRYTTGKVPKAFKVIPALQNWEEVLYLTSPERWSPHAVFVATRLFASNLNAKMAQRFYSLVLLPRFRTEILDNKKIHFATFMVRSWSLLSHRHDALLRVHSALCRFQRHWLSRASAALPGRSVASPPSHTSIALPGSSATAIPPDVHKCPVGGTARC